MTSILGLAPVAQSSSALSKDFFTNIKKIQNIECPTYMVHGLLDSMINVSHSQKMKQVVSNMWKYQELEGFSHFSVFDSNEFLDNILALLKELSPPDSVHHMRLLIKPPPMIYNSPEEMIKHWLKPLGLESFAQQFIMFGYIDMLSLMSVDKLLLDDMGVPEQDQQLVLNDVAYRKMTYPLLDYIIESSSLRSASLLSDVVSVRTDYVLTKETLRNEQVAVKKFSNVSLSNSQEVSQQVKRLIQLEHPNIMSPFAVCFENHPQRSDLINVFLLSPWQTLPTMYTYMSSMNPSKEYPPIINRLKILECLLQGLSYLHSLNPPIYHQRLSARKVYLDENKCFCILSLSSNHLDVLSSDMYQTDYVNQIHNQYLAQTYSNEQQHHHHHHDDEQPESQILKFNNMLKEKQDIFAFGFLMCHFVHFDKKEYNKTWFNSQIKQLSQLNSQNNKTIENSTNDNVSDTTSACPSSPDATTPRVFHFDSPRYNMSPFKPTSSPIFIKTKTKSNSAFVVTSNTNSSTPSSLADSAENLSSTPTNTTGTPRSVKSRKGSSSFVNEDNNTGYRTPDEYVEQILSRCLDNNIHIRPNASQVLQAVTELISILSEEDEDEPDVEDDEENDLLPALPDTTMNVSSSVPVQYELPPVPTTPPPPLPSLERSNSGELKAAFERSKARGNRLKRRSSLGAIPTSTHFSAQLSSVVSLTSLPTVSDTMSVSHSQTHRDKKTKSTTYDKLSTSDLSKSSSSVSKREKQHKRSISGSYTEIKKVIASQSPSNTPSTSSNSLNSSNEGKSKKVKSTTIVNSVSSSSISSSSPSTSSERLKSSKKPLKKHSKDNLKKSTSTPKKKSSKRLNLFDDPNSAPTSTTTLVPITTVTPTTPTTPTPPASLVEDVKRLEASGKRRSEKKKETK
eukprot:TRINITY_DN1069_c2_g1_i4.p1 TRINITY_DN1069_c2_g1~~TRINITY_DN1069_c2_g1_i4.p1  ORF type:complete len:905 (-),score=209.64 TRINITY_DN1069_c2_g1_i4:89-2803(-)